MSEPSPTTTPLLTDEVEQTLGWAQAAIEADPDAHTNKAERAAAVRVLVGLRNRLYEIDDAARLIDESKATPRATVPALETCCAITRDMLDFTLQYKPTASEPTQ